MPRNIVTILRQSFNNNNKAIIKKKTIRHQKPDDQKKKCFRLKTEWDISCC